MSENSEFLTPQEVSHLLRMPVTSVYDLARKGKLPGAFKVGRHWRFADRVLTEWLDEQMGVALEKATSGMTRSAASQAKSILVIEDDSLVLRTISKILESEGFEVTGAESGIEGFEMFQSGNWDLVVCDIRMKEQDGIETLKKMRDLERERLGYDVNPQDCTPVIMITGYASESAPIDAIKLGVRDYFMKPLDAEQLLESVHEHTRLQCSSN